MAGLSFPQSHMDLYGTNHDPRCWVEPEVFRPERFREWNGSAYNFIPQGGGDYAWVEHFCHTGHSFSQQTLLTGQSSALEYSLWAAVRMMQKRLKYFRR